MPGPAGAGNPAEGKREILLIGPIGLGECLKKSWHGRQVLTDVSIATGMTNVEVVKLFNTTKLYVHDKRLTNNRGTRTLSAEFPELLINGPCSFTIPGKSEKKLMIHLETVRLLGIDLSQPIRGTQLFISLTSPGFPWRHEDGLGGTWYASNCTGGRLSWEISGELKHINDDN